MIKDKLMIGNWVDFGYTYKKEFLRRACQVISIGEKEIVVMDKGQSLVLSDDAYPIELTTEILEKCGFEKDGKYKYAQGDLKFSVYVWDTGLITAETSDCNLCDLKHLHQLQNLYYCLTGQELEVKL